MEEVRLGLGATGGGIFFGLGATAGGGADLDAEAALATTGTSSTAVFSRLASGALLVSKVFSEVALLGDVCLAA